MKLPVPNVVELQRFRLNRHLENQFIAQIVLIRTGPEETKTDRFLLIHEMFGLVVDQMDKKRRKENTFQ